LDQNDNNYKCGAVLQEEWEEFSLKKLGMEKKLFEKSILEERLCQCCVY
jgi:hypothetical protein